MRPIYIAGDMLFKGSILMREQEKQMLLDAGLEVHSPIDDKEINDKSNQTVESNNGLAERIVHKDTAAIMQADTILIEPQHFAQGTLVELGQIKGYNDMNKAIMDIINNGGDIEDIVEYLTVDNPYKKVYAHLEDIRRTDLPEVGDRRSFSVNQYVYGVVLDLTEGRGFQELEDIIKELKGE